MSYVRSPGRQCPISCVYIFDTLQVTNDTHFIQTFYTVGPLPQDLRDVWPRYSLYFGPNGERLNFGPLDFDNSEENRARTARFPPLDSGPPVPLPSLEDVFMKYKAEDIGTEEARKLVCLFRGVFKLNPSERPSGAQLLEKRW